MKVCCCCPSTPLICSSIAHAGRASDSLLRKYFPKFCCRCCESCNTTLLAYQPLQILIANDDFKLSSQNRQGLGQRGTCLEAVAPMIHCILKFTGGCSAFDDCEGWVLAIVLVNEERGHFGIVFNRIVFPITAHYTLAVDR